MALAYRREIDGLRAVAVSAVVLYHAGLPVPAGYVGVDIFFVISGYLITALLLREHADSGRIDVSAFYARRVRRIFPAAILMVLAVLTMVPLLSAPARAGIVQSVAAAALFAANVFFHLTTAGYFNGDASQYPLLHLWSLSVEEQFYLAWPALLIVLLRWRLPLRWAMAGLALASLLLAERWLRGSPSAAFFETPARLWPLAIGGWIAASPARALPRTTAWLGMGMVAFACVVAMPHFPGFGALPAILGAALIVAAVHGGAANALLASRPMVGIGLISYSLYLWHWPLLAIDRILRVGPAPTPMRMSLVLLAILLAVASYRWIETPLRRPWVNNRRTVIAGVGAMASLFVLALAWAPPDIESAAVATKEMPCHRFVPGDPRVQRLACVSGPKVVIWGDSFAHSWTPLAQQLGLKLAMPVATAARDGCPPIAGVREGLRSEQEAADCRAWNARAIAYLRSEGADTLVMAARWNMFLPSGRDGLAESIRLVAPHVRRILVIGPSPELSDEPAKCRALGKDCAQSRRRFESESADVSRILSSLPAITIVAPADYLCDGDACPAFRNGNALYDDRAHVSYTTAIEFGRRVASDWH